MFFDKPAKIGEDRLRKVLVSDKKNLPPQLKKIIESDIVEVLENYLSVEKGTFDFDVNINAEGKYELHFSLLATFIKSYGVCL